MKLDRNINLNGRGKYALLKLRKLEDFTKLEALGECATPIAAALKTLQDAGILDWGLQGTEAEFFVVRLKDKYAESALHAYAGAAWRDGEEEYSEEITEMANRAGAGSPFCKKPD